jgi:hypothetical protein
MLTLSDSVSRQLDNHSFNTAGPQLAVAYFPGTAKSWITDRMWCYIGWPHRTVFFIICQSLCVYLCNCWNCWTDFYQIWYWEVLLKYSHCIPDFVSGACGAYRILVGHLREGDCLEDLGVDGRIILEWILNKLVGRTWTGLIWLRWT